MRMVTIHRAADRHAELHERRFASTVATEVEADPLAPALALACDALGMADNHGKVVITVDWPHDPVPEGADDA